jgi:site-specific recombinase XerD
VTIDLPSPATSGRLALDEAIGRFLDDLTVGRARSTVDTYRYALRRFQEYLDHARTHPPRTVGELTEDDPVGFARWISDGGRAPRTTVHLYTTAVARLYAYLVRERHRSDLPLETIRLRLAQLRGKRAKKLPRVPTDDAMERVLAAARAVPAAASRPEQLIRLRDVAIVETLRGSGLRVSEAVSLRRGDLEHDRQRAVVTGKGGKQRLVFFTDEAWRAIWTYLAARGDEGGRGAGALPVFVRHDRAAGQRISALSTDAVRDVIWRLAVAAGLPDAGLTPHRFRAWFATHLVAETGDLAAVQDLLGHESADTTRVYTRVAAQRLADVHRRAFGPGARPAGRAPPRP